MKRPMMLACRECQERFPAEEVFFLCPEPRCKAKDHPASDLPAQWAGQPVFRPRQYEYSVQCPYSPHRAYFKICPRCGARLPAATGKASTVAVIGSSISGKTCFMTGLIRQIMTRLAREDSYEMGMLWDDSSSKKYFTEREQIIYEDHMLPDTTARQDPLAILELTVQFPVRGWMSRLRHGSQAAISLVMPDPSGEYFESSQEVYYLNYLSNARAILLMVDPLTSRAYRKKLVKMGKGEPEYSGNTTADTLRSFVSAMRQETNQQTGKLNKDLALVLCKCDEEGLFNPDDKKWKGRFPLQGRSYDAKLAGSISKMVSQHLHDDLQMADLVALARANFKSVGFFAVSAFGSPPVTVMEHGFPTKKLNEPEPRRVEEPFLWVLHQWGYV